MNKNQTLPPLDYFLAFEAAAHYNGFAAAARSLNTSESAISRKIRLLEYHFKTTLFERKHRSIQLNQQGIILLQEITPALNSLRTTSQKVLYKNAQHTIKLAATHSVSGLWLMPRLSIFHDLYKNIRIMLISSDNDEECMAKDVDLCILRGNGQWEGYQSSLLFRETIYPVCAPSYQAKTPLSIENLPQCDLIGVSNTHTEWVSWASWLSIHAQNANPLNQIIQFNTYPLVVEAAINGLGVALGWRHLVDRLIDEQKLIRPLGDNAIHTPFGYYLLSKNDTSQSADCDTFRQWLIGQLNNEQAPLGQ